MSIKTKDEIELMRKAGNIVGDTHIFLETFIKPGITTNELNDMAHNYIISRGAIPSFLNFNGYPASICTSINEEVVHGIPSDRELEDGDIISIDIGALFEGYHGDSAWTYSVGKIDKEKQNLLKHTEKALFVGLETIKDGSTIGDIGYAISEYAKQHNLGVVKELVGHGIGKNLHEKPDVPNYGNKGSGMTLKSGMTIAVEPMFNSGSAEVAMLMDDWTIVTNDSKPSAHFEHTVLVTENGYEILTKR